jgi:hypothetical protein
MTLRPTPVERAFELARSGECESVNAVRKRLKDEGVSAAQIFGPSLSRQLRELCVLSMHRLSLQEP